MNVEEVAKRVQDVIDNRNDSEYAHMLEDDLWQEVLMDISNGDTDDPKAIANEALKTTLVDFSRRGG